MLRTPAIGRRLSGMSHRDTYPAGVPCWVETLQPDPVAAGRFYADVLGWDLVGDRDYAVARLDSRDVAGIGALPPQAAPAAWITHVRVEDVETAVARVVAAGGRAILPRLDVPPAGRLGVVADPTGARFCVWEAGVREGAAVINEPGSWAMSALRTPDPDRAAVFYAAVFGWEREAYGPVSLLRLPGYVGGEPTQPVPRDVVAVMAATDGGAEWAVDFRVPDTRAVAARTVELGGRVLVAPHEQPPAFLAATLEDPAGVVFSVTALQA